jgi:3-dehydroquinate synthase
LFSLIGQFHRVLILADEKTRNSCLPLLIGKAPYLAGLPVHSIPAGEPSKSADGLESIWKALASENAGRDSLLINLGGGVVTDLGAFAASTYKRGIAFVNIPTSLIGQADAAIGGKCGINSAGVKNLAGLFSDPRAVFIDPDFLRSLPVRHLKAGWAEMLKMALLCGGEFWNTLSAVGFNDPVDNNMIFRSIDYKCKVVATDPLDHSSRKALNFGHTAGHALESISLEADDDPMLHGEAVAAGIILEACLSARILGFPEEILAKISRMISATFSLRPVNEWDFAELESLVGQDKKSLQGISGFTLLREPGDVVIDVPCSAPDLRDAVAFYNTMVR